MVNDGWLTIMKIGIFSICTEFFPVITEGSVRQCSIALMPRPLLLVNLHLLLFSSLLKMFDFIQAF